VFLMSQPVRSNTGHIDHFIPWSKHPIDLGHIFVLAVTLDQILNRCVEIVAKYVCPHNFKQLNLLLLCASTASI